ncbi:Carboxylic ester hydrolase [Aphelenchoides besseyi]|nr:Carboxylic ester hydrolase [Aphelenchoides besseyi]
MIFGTKLLKFFAFISLNFHLANARHLWLNSGIIEGRTVSVWPHEVDVYKGIPFSEKPVGNRRFQLPEPKRPWHGILNTTEYSRPCISNTTQTTSPQSNVSEDCLYLNVFADARCQSRLCPILFYIHGGDFYYDSAVMFNDTEIINKYASDEIVFVIPAYRMGIFGFLDLGKELDDTVYNIGFHDIILALRWVQKECLNFGGDVNRITIVGNSGGAMAVQYLFGYTGS